MTRLRFPLVVCACCLFWAFAGFLLGAVFRHGLAGLILGLLFGIGYTLFSIGAAEKFPLETWDAKLIENAWAPNLYQMLHELCAKTEIELPTLYNVPSVEPNAFVVAGRDGNAAVVVTNGLTRQLESGEVQAVMALMIARLATGAMPVWTVAATLAGQPLQWGLACRKNPRLKWLGSLLLAVFAFPAAGLMRLAWNADAVAAADHHAAHLAETPGALETALRKIETAANQAEIRQQGEGEIGNPTTALLFAVPPLAALPGEVTFLTFWQRALPVFPYRSPDVAQRAARFLSGGLPGVGLSKPNGH